MTFQALRINFSPLPAGLDENRLLEKGVSQKTVRTLSVTYSPLSAMVESGESG
jgi:hypothetical protein